MRQILNINIKSEWLDPNAAQMIDGGVEVFGRDQRVWVTNTPVIGGENSDWWNSAGEERTWVADWLTPAEEGDINKCKKLIESRQIHDTERC